MKEFIDVKRRSTAVRKSVIAQIIFKFMILRSQIRKNKDNFYYTHSQMKCESCEPIKN